MEQVYRLDRVKVIKTNNLSQKTPTEHLPKDNDEYLVLRRSKKDSTGMDLLRPIPDKSIDREMMLPSNDPYTLVTSMLFKHFMFEEIRTSHAPDEEAKLRITAPQSMIKKQRKMEVELDFTSKAERDRVLAGIRRETLSWCGKVDYTQFPLTEAEQRANGILDPSWTSSSEGGGRGLMPKRKRSDDEQPATATAAASPPPPPPARKKAKTVKKKPPPAPAPTASAADDEVVYMGSRAAPVKPHANYYDKAMAQLSSDGAMANWDALSFEWMVSELDGSFEGEG